MNEDKLFELYTLAELSYKNHFKNAENDIKEIYPDGWYSNKDYRLKIEIIAEAIKTNKLIINTPAYQKMLERVERNLTKD